MDRTMMSALQPEVQDAIFEAIRPLLPAPKRRGRPRKSDRLCFEALMHRLATGSSFETVESTYHFEVSDTTLRARRDEWIAAGIFDHIVKEATAAYDRIIELDLANVALDGSLHRAPCGGEGTGQSPFERNRFCWKWSVAVDGAGIPIGYTIDAGNTNDYKLLRPTLDMLVENGLIADIDTLHLDRGYGYVSTPDLIASYGIAELDMCMRRKPGQGAVPFIGLKKRWIVEVANSWLANHGQLRRNTDRRTRHRLAALQLAITVIITSRLLKHRNRYWRDANGNTYRNNFR